MSSGAVGGAASSGARPGGPSAVFVHQGRAYQFSGHASTSVAVAKMIERLETEREFKVVHDLCGCVSSDPEKETKLVDLLASYFESQGRRVELLSWAVQFEVQQTEIPTGLFRLETTVRPLIERLSKTVAAKPAILSKELATDVRFILDQTDQFLSELEQAIAFFPIEIREGFVVLAKEVAKKFPTTNNAVSVVLFLRFICPSILQAHAFHIVDSPVPAEVLQVLLPIAKVLQSIANEVLENKISSDPTTTPAVVSFIERHIELVRAFSARMIDEEDLNMLKKALSSSKSGAPKVNKETALQDLTSYISSPDFPLPTLQPNDGARSLSSAVRQRKVQSLEDKCIHLDDVLDLVRINLVVLIPDIATHIVEAAKFLDSLSIARNELEKLGVKQLLITSGTVTSARDFYDSSSFKGDVVVDTSTGSKLLQLFEMRARRQSARSIQSSTTPVKNLRRNSEKQLNLSGLRDRSKEPDKDKGKEKAKDEEDKGPSKIGTVYIIIWNFINFEKPIDGAKNELDTLLTQCGATPETVATIAAKVKRKQKLKDSEASSSSSKSSLLSFFTLRKRAPSKVDQK